MTTQMKMIQMCNKISPCGYFMCTRNKEHKGKHQVRALVRIGNELVHEGRIVKEW